VQRLTFSTSADDEVVKTRAGWEDRGLAAQAATVSIVNVGQTKRELDEPRNSVITVTLHPEQQFVAIASHNHHVATEGTLFINFARGRRNFLSRRGVLNAGAIARILHVDKQREEIAVRSSSKSLEQFVLVATRKRVGSPNPEGIDPDAIGILDFYELLNEIGARFPRTVVEACVVGHAWHQGPIIRGTMDRSDNLLERDPNDADARPKDFHPESRTTTTMSPGLDAAFAEGGRVASYGCSHMHHVYRETSQTVLRIEAGLARDEFYTVSVGSNFRVHTTIDFTKRSIGQYAASTVLGRTIEQGEAAGWSSYNGLAARALGVPFFAAAAGAEASLGRPLDAKQDLMMFVQPMPVDTALAVSRQKMFPPAGASEKEREGAENHGIHVYFAMEFGGDYQRDEVGYTDYAKLLGAELPDPGWSTERHSVYIEIDSDRPSLRLPSGFRVHGIPKHGAKLSAISPPVPHTEADVSGHLYVVTKSAPLGIEIRDHTTLGEVRILAYRSDDSRDFGIWVTADGKTLLRIRDGGSASFRKPTGSILARKMKLVFDSGWGFDEDVAAGTTEGDLLESVEPKWYW
jgi:hypothetical protein